MSEMGYIYKIQNKINGKVYIGQTRQLEKRKRWHFNCLRINKHSNMYLQHAYNKYGPENFEFDIVAKIDDVEKLNDAEIAEIERLDSMYGGNGYNLRDGGGVMKLCDDAIRRIKEKVTGQKKQRRTDPQLVSLHISMSKAGPKHPMYGKTFDEKRRCNISAGLRIFRDNNAGASSGSANSMFGKTHSDETKELIRQKRIGRKQSAQAKANQIKAQGKPVECVNTGQVFGSAKEAAAFVGLHPSSVSACCRGKIPAAGKSLAGEKLQWKYIK